MMLRTFIILILGITIVLNLVTLHFFQSNVEYQKGVKNNSLSPLTNFKSSLKRNNTYLKMKNVPSITCRENVIVCLAQKGNHSSYDRDSYGLLIKSLDLLYQNYLNDYFATASLIIFHTGDFTEKDREVLEQRQLPKTKGTLHIVDISNTSFWALPQFLSRETTNDWFLPDYTVGYRHMMRWYTLKLYEYLRQEWPCSYQYLMRMDEESFIYSKINYDVFSFMKQNQYSYGFRQCSFELRHIRPLWAEYRKIRPNISVQRPGFASQDLCGFYNNWFILELRWIYQSDVQDWLQWVDGTGYIYRKRVNDLILHTTAVYAFLHPAKIHRFLDFTYQHMTNYKSSKCPLWGAISGGYLDSQAHSHIQRYWAEDVLGRQCPRPGEKVPYFPRIMNLSLQDLSPTFHHMPNDTTLRLPEVAAGHVDLENTGLRSG
jgi:Glycolipid 2-alpha-mannosyltransferase